MYSLQKICKPIRYFIIYHDNNKKIWSTDHVNFEVLLQRTLIFLYIDFRKLEQKKDLFQILGQPGSCIINVEGVQLVQYM